MEATMFCPDQDECKNNYIGMGRKIKRHYLVDTEHQENQWALWAFSRQGTTTANFFSGKDASAPHQIKKDGIKVVWRSLDRR